MNFKIKQRQTIKPGLIPLVKVKLDRKIYIFLDDLKKIFRN